MERGHDMSNESEQSGVGSGYPGATGTIAWVDLRTGSGAGAQTVGWAIRQIGRAVRADDRVCPVGTTSVAVQFGPAAGGVPLEVLGDRLARAVGSSVPFAPTDPGLTVAIGVAAPSRGDAADRVALRARSAARSSARSLGTGDHARTRTTTAVSVDEPVTGHGPTVTGAGTAVGLRRRGLHRYGAGRIDGVATLRPDDGSTSSVRGSGSLRASNLCVLVVDPMAVEGGGPGFASLTAVSVAERLGCRVASDRVSPDEPLVMTVDDVDVDLVVLVLDGAWVGRSPHWATGAWGLPARLTTAYVDKGTPVLAVGAGAGAGALAACVAQGAMALFNLDRLAGALRVAGQFPARRGPPGGRTRLPRPLPVPGRAHGRGAPRPLLPDRGVGGPGHRRRARGVPHHRPFPHPLGAPQARSALAAGGRGHRQQPRPRATTRSPPTRRAVVPGQPPAPGGPTMPPAASRPRSWYSGSSIVRRRSDWASVRTDRRSVTRARCRASGRSRRAPRSASPTA